MNRFLIFMFVVATCFGLNVAFDMFPCPSNTILITNELGPSLVLQYHCHSRDNNLNVSNLQFNETKVINFGDKLGRRTRWTCLLKHGLYMRYYSEFIGYRMGNVRRCGHTRHWIARKDGIYLTRNQNPPPLFHHGWNKTN
ncbi:LOW QUALITY PROTEIN: S-protein homolog 14 [Arabidopsis lyrata subsp. lyrata]|uniref:LOW QUALITY PROTEIN: S-protein homolog 14 n=1 Tax=Arabidopsis lyrata subsp. lyrata TaxID=81972 RepID=UPI000A29AD29|nr:LOW QUALITY PROTEIN: S-protein homolog 14 [Arabidopsis lyrata subsp. lyrata]|eukprot:XP_020865716.1 LOW QUALITY PROTEIN: S-protein homolog 14 [Arabidopsis lyrata subsp. lyrata]